MKSVTLAQFDEEVDEFLSHLGSYPNEYYCTAQELAAGFISDLRKQLYCIDPEKEARRAKYEELKKEFEL